MKYNGRLRDRVLTPSKLAAYVNLNNQIESNNEKKTKKAKQANKKTKNVEQLCQGTLVQIQKYVSINYE